MITTRDFRSTCYHSDFFGTLNVSCEAWIKDVEIILEVECPKGFTIIRARRGKERIDVKAEKPGEPFYEAELEKPLKAKPIVERLRHALNRGRMEDVEKELKKLTSDILASVLSLCHTTES